MKGTYTSRYYRIWRFPNLWDWSGVTSCMAPAVRGLGGVPTYSIAFGGWGPAHDLALVDTALIWLDLLGTPPLALAES